MFAAVLRIFGRPATAGETMFIGAIMLFLGCGGVFMVLKRWEWMQKRWPRMFRWGKGSWSIPASRVGVSYGFATAAVIGMLCVNDAQNWWPFGDRDYFYVGLILWLLLGVGVFLRDYFRHVNQKDD